MFIAKRLLISISISVMRGYVVVLKDIVLSVVRRSRWSDVRDSNLRVSWIILSVRYNKTVAI